jgi:lipoprotein signal peptidase
VADDGMPTKTRETTMNRGTNTLAVPSLRDERDGRLRQRQILLGLLVAVIVLDQAMKWWAWRHAPVAIINDGGDPLVGKTVGGWYADPLTGALLDLLDFGLLSTAVSILVRRRCPVAVLVPAALTVAGWSSNLLDRLGMHYWTAPGSVRGAVDFIHLGDHYFNVADFFIILGTPLLLLSVGLLGRRATKTTARSESAARSRPRLPRASTRMSVLAGALAVIAVTGIGAANYGGVTVSLASASASSHH